MIFFVCFQIKILKTKTDKKDLKYSGNYHVLLLNHQSRHELKVSFRVSHILHLEPYTASARAEAFTSTMRKGTPQSILKGLVSVVTTSKRI